MTLVGPRLHSSAQVSVDAEEIASVKAKLKVPGKNRSRDLHKMQLLELRVEAAGLQEQVEALQFMTSLEADSSCDFLSSDNRRLGAWQAEDHHDMFHKQATAQLLFAGLSRGLNANLVSVGSSHEYKVLEQLSHDLSNLFYDTDSVFQSKGLSAISSPFLQVNQQSLSASNTRIDFLKCDVLPFDYRFVAKAFMDKMTGNFKSEEDKHIPSTLKEKVVARATTLELERMKIRFRFTGYKYVEAKREVIVLSGQNEFFEAFGVAVDGVRYQERSWCVLSEVSPGLCLIQLCISVTLEAKPLLGGRREFIGTLCELLATFKQDMFDSVQQEVERALLRAS
ncbi:hypothetical protein GN958_ATG20167 [Phytophthora infestans]|nr:hypothetical protein GN958_ATG20167 [Phytophthora infestans]